MGTETKNCDRLPQGGNECALAPADFKFPYAAYPTQVKLMQAIYEALDAGAIGLFESPTGTGKSLSVICATLKWLADNRGRVEVTEKFDGPKWVSEQADKQLERETQDLEEARAVIFKKRVENVKKGVGRKKERLVGRKKIGKCISRIVDDERFMVVGCDCETRSKWGNGKSDSDFDGRNDFGSQTTIRALKGTPDRMRVVFATRTHSQLSQFLSEIKKTAFARSNDPPLSVITFGGRLHMCVNEDVKRLSTAAAITDRCLELQKASGSKKRTATGALKNSSVSTCPFRDPVAEAVLRDLALTQLHDLEEITAKGAEWNACPYYGVRAALDSGSADVVLVPYSALLHGATRESLNLEIDERTIMVFDEAHNLPDVISSLHTTQLSLYQLDSTKESFDAYLKRYESRLSPRNRFALSQVEEVMKGLRRLLASETKNTLLETPKFTTGARVLLPSAIVFESKIDNINLFQLVTWLKDSRLIQKLNGFVDARLAATDSSEELTEPEARGRFAAEAKRGLVAFEQFVVSLTHGVSSGRVLVQVSSDGDPRLSYLKYFLLDPSEPFAVCCEKARSTLLLGGTLSPRDVLKSSLLRMMSKHKPVVEIECEHVVPRERLKTVVAISGPTGVPLEFSFKNRGKTEILDELGRILINLATVSREGMIVFFPSYVYEKQVFARWQDTGILRAISRRKQVFREIRGNDDVFSAYASAVQKNGKNGAILSAVLGGKLSEGINFADGLGRTVLVVGMPFANIIDDVETQAKLEGMSTREKGEWLENRCMTSVNQGIGRVIRHAHDWASVVLCDSRYSRERIRHKLPKFVAETTSTVQSFGEAIAQLTRFYRKVTSAP